MIISLITSLNDKLNSLRNGKIFLYSFLNCTKANDKLLGFIERAVKNFLIEL